jgi:hypothetical protein
MRISSVPFKPSTDCCGDSCSADEMAADGRDRRALANKKAGARPLFQVRYGGDAQRAVLRDRRANPAGLVARPREIVPNPDTPDAILLSSFPLLDWEQNWNMARRNAICG